MSIVKVPQDRNRDYDFIAFSFNGKHSYEDFEIYRVSEGKDGYSEQLNPTLEDKTADVPGLAGQYYFGSSIKNRVISVKIAFDSLTEEKLYQMRDWLSGTDIHDLWFSEAPHRVYSAKVTGQSILNSLAFVDSQGKRFYKGTGQIQFTCYYPYARTPDLIETRTGNLLDGSWHSSYESFKNYNEIKETLPLYDNGTCPYGQLPFYVSAKLISPLVDDSAVISVSTEGVVYQVNSNNFTIDEQNGEITYIGEIQ